MRKFRYVVLMPHVFDVTAYTESRAKRKIEEHIANEETATTEGGGKTHTFKPFTVACEEIMEE